MKKCLTIIYMMLCLGLGARCQDTLSVAFVGDVMMHAKQLEYNYTSFFNKAEHLMKEPDITVANMEFALGGKPYSGYPSFSAPDGYALYMCEIGTDVFLTANNHILDKGDKGLERTLGIYDRMMADSLIQYTGCAMDEASDTLINPLIIDAKGIRLALVNFTYGTNYSSEKKWPAVKRMNKDSVKKMFDRAADANADFVIALPHWGEEYSLTHSSNQKEWAKWMVDQGASLIVGAHPHVVQDTTHISGTPVIYSMGNAVSNMSAVNTRLELMVVARFLKDEDGNTSMLEPELKFLWCSLPGHFNDTYTVLPVDEMIDRRDLWKNPADYDNMISTLKRVTKTTGIQSK